jgi:hypothetical protein
LLKERDRGLKRFAQQWRWPSEKNGPHAEGESEHANYHEQANEEHQLNGSLPETFCDSLGESVQLSTLLADQRVDLIDRMVDSGFQIAVERTTLVVERLQDRRSFQAKIRHHGATHLVDLGHSLDSLRAYYIVKRVAFSLEQLRDRLTSRGQPVDGLAGSFQVMEGLSKKASILRRREEQEFGLPSRLFRHELRVESRESLHLCQALADVRDNTGHIACGLFHFLDEWRSQ